MKKIVVSVLGYDRPGIVASVSKILFENRCNIEDVSQTTLQTEFAGVFIASIPDDTREEDLLTRLEGSLAPMGLSVLAKPMQPAGEWVPAESEPFVLTTFGPDRLGLVAGITEVLARFGVNITNLKAVFRGGDDPRHNIMIYEVDIPVGIDPHAFRRVLHERAQELGLDISLQHRDIFEAVHRI
jgi:glycine cleavage system transcriptional repressor